MADITPFTIIVEFLPALLITLTYVTLFGEKRNRFIEAFIALLFLKSISFFLFNIWWRTPITQPGFNDAVLGDGLLAVIFTDFIFHVGYAIQEFFTWIMVSFLAVLFGQLVLMLKMALQDPMKMKFSNLIKRVVGKEPVSDGYKGLRDRLDNIRFEGIEPQPLSPEVQQKAYSESWRDYLIIGLVTIVPSIPLYMDSTINAYAYGVIVILTWIYRFGYPASNRIAKAAGIKLGDRDIGSEMMRGVLGWFFRLNLLLSVFTISLDFIPAILSSNPAALSEQIQRYSFGLTVAAPPILFAIILLPLFEDFSVVLYKRVFEAISQGRNKLSQFDIKGFARNLASSAVVGGIAAGALVAAVMATTLNYAQTLGPFNFSIFPGQVDISAFAEAYYAPDNLSMIDPAIWSLLIFLIPLAMMILAGVLGHQFRKRVKGGLEGFAFWVGSLVTLAVWYIFPGMDYISDFTPTPTRFGGAFFYRLTPLLYPPGPEDFLWRIANQLVIALPLFVSVTLFILYYLDFSDKWEEEQGIESSPLINVKYEDVRDIIVLFVGGLIASIIGVVILSLFIPPFDLYWTMYGLIAEIGNPDGLELVLAESVSYFIIIAEHNIIRTFMMLVVGPLFWIVILWFVAVQRKTPTEKNIGISALVLTAIAGVASFIWTIMDMNSGVFVPAQVPGDPNWPWTFAAQLGLRAGILYGILFGLYMVIFVINRYGRGSSGGWWLPPLITFFAIEYFVYDDQFTIIAVIILPMILAFVYKGYQAMLPPKPDSYESNSDSEWQEPKRDEDFLILYIKMGFLSLALAEVLSTALWVAGMGTAIALAGGNGLVYVMSILPHGVIEIPAFLFAAAAALRIARDLGEDVSDEKWDTLPEKAQDLLGDRRLWRTYVFIMFFLLLAALVEENITQIIVNLVIGLT